MRLFWNGKEITEYCSITGCNYRDAAGGKSDTLELTLDRASVWYRWGPEDGDEIEITETGLETGIMYLTAVIPVRDQYRILASGLKAAANRKTWAAFENMSLRALVERCAAECGMTGKVFGMEDELLIPYAMRKGEGCAAFLSRIGRAEGFKIKTWGGAIRAIYLPWAERQPVSARLNIDAKQEGVTYRRRKNAKIASLTVMSPWAQATARDTDAEGANDKTITTLPAMNAAQAGRWARNLLREINRQAEELTIEQTYNPAMAAMTRVEITGGTDMDGEWLIEEAEHDLKNKTTSARMLRVLEGIR